ncbi:MAG: hypothetical protein IJ083_12040 [Clostridia bacterium]|nr:hypothetical protein [Clostridia bacterium]
MARAKELHQYRREDLLEIMVQQQLTMEQVQLATDEADEKNRHREIEMETPGSMVQETEKIRLIMEETDRKAQEILRDVQKLRSDWAKEADDLRKKIRQAEQTHAADDGAATLKKSGEEMLRKARAEAKEILGKAEAERDAIRREGDKKLKELNAQIQSLSAQIAERSKNTK